MSQDISEAELHAYVDGLLSEAERAALDARLAASPEDAGRVRDWREQGQALRHRFNPVLDEPIPPRLLMRPPTFLRRYAMAACFAVGGIMLGSLLGWMARGMLPGLPLSAGGVPGFARQAAIAHVVYAPEVRHPVEVGADQEEHLVRWLSKRLGTELKCPKLSGLGYELVGGRLLSGSNGPVAHFMFQDGKGARLTLYVSVQKGDARQTAFRFSQEDRIGVFYWIDGNYGYALSGEVGRETLLQIADAVYKQLNP
jgi:anti-sigma factor RsiW